MILVKLRGGLGNQMFQYAAARRLAEVHDTTVRIDTSWYDRVPAGTTPRSYELHDFRITGTRANRWETIGTDGVRNTRLRDVPIAIYRKVRPKFRFVGERQFHFDPRILELPDHVCLFGYWISARYFGDAGEAIRRELRPRRPLSDEARKVAAAIGATESVAVHVRRGDYAHHPATAASHGFCGLDYYRRAVDVVRRRVSDPHFFVFSDDPDWAFENLDVGGSVDFVSHNRGPSGVEDLCLMSAARHQIIANSSFSWWAAWLNGQDGKVVVAPRRWMNDPSCDTSDVLPEEWTAL